MPAGRYGDGGVGDPPTPGTSNVTTVGLGQRVDERHRELDVGAEAVEEQKRRTRAIALAHCVADVAPADARVLDAERTVRRTGEAGGWHAAYRSRT